MEINSETTDLEKRYSIYVFITGVLFMMLAISSFLLRNTIIMRGRLRPEISYVIGLVCLGGAMTIVSYNYLILSDRLIETRGDIAMGAVILFIFPLIVTQESQVIPAITVVLTYYFLRLIAISIRGDIISEIRETNIKDESNSQEENE